MPTPTGPLEPPPPSDHWRAALAATGVGVVAGGLRYWNLSHPSELVFDETYYAKDAWALLRTGAERVWVEDANEQILAGDTSGMTDEAAFASHPPLGKWVIAAGEMVEGLTPLGWRLGVAVLGALAAVVMVYLARRVTRSTVLGALAGLLVALDGLALVTSRIAMLDGTLMFLIVLAALFLVRDRDETRAALARQIEPASPAPRPPTNDTVPDGIPGVADSGEASVGSIKLWRPWRLLMGIALGLACATKWSGLPVLVVFGLLTVAWQAGALSMAGARRPVTRTLLVDAPMAFLTVVGSAAVTYLATWAGWFRSDDGYERQWAATNPAEGPVAGLVPDALRSLAHYHEVAFGLLFDLESDHHWQSSPAGWLLLLRPVLLYRYKPTMGQDGCTAEECVADILAVGTPLTWWLGIAATLFLLWRAIARADWRGWLVVGGVAATWAVWFLLGDRPLFSFYVVATLPFLVLGIVVTLRVLPDGFNARGPAIAARGRRWMVAVGVLLLVATAVQAWFLWPIWVGEPLPLEEWRWRIWLPGWS